jgi:hypothetical protein
MLAAQMSLSPYVLDFLTMLSKGIYVFSSSSNTTCLLQDVGNNSNKKEVHHLRIFAYNERHHAFTLSSVEHHEGVIRDTLALHQVLHIRAAAASAESHDDTDGEKNDNDNHVCKIEILLQMHQQHRAGKDQIQPQRTVVLTLSSQEDRDTMLDGLVTSLPYLKQFRFCSSDHEFDNCGRRRCNNHNPTSTGTNRENSNSTATDIAVMAPSFKLNTAAGHTAVQRSKPRRRRNRASY